MDDLSKFEKICRAMANPSFYPHPVDNLERRDSHISAVFLTGSQVYKLKKPFDFGFLDYTRLDKRHRMCERELELNQRLSSGVYEEVVEIRESGDGFHLGNRGQVVEYAVRMRQLRDEDTLSSLLLRAIVGHAEMIRLGRMLGSFYSRSEKSPEISRFGEADTISFNTEENFRQLEPFVGVLIGNSQFEVVREASRGFFRDRIGIFEERIAAGWICDGHGDLRAEHVYFSDGLIQILDCIEFNDRFRYGDAASDLAFLHMDMERLGRSDLSLSVLAGYIEESGDFGIYKVLDFYSCYRALVKLKVACLTWSELEDGSRRDEMRARATQYLDLAFRYAVQFSRPTVWVMCGLPGTGKSTVAQGICETLGIPVFQSDQVRTTLPEYALHSGPVPIGTGLYRPELRGRVYAHMLALAQDELKRGSSVILDGTFARRHWREETVRLARDLDANVVFFEFTSSQNLLSERLGRRGSAEERLIGKTSPRDRVDSPDGSGGRRAEAVPVGGQAPETTADSRDYPAGQRKVAGTAGKTSPRDSLSDARAEHLLGLAEQYEPIDELSASFHAVIDTEVNGPDECLGIALSKAYAMKQRQIGAVMRRL